MGDYNPKTSYQFRWSDSKKIQKFIQGQVIVHDVSFDVSPSQDVVTYKFDTVPEAKEIAKTAKYCYENNIPMIIYDAGSNETWISTQCASETECNISRTIDDQILTAFINMYDDRIEVSAFSHEMLSADNVKTLFGNQSIIGTGNIDLYRHQLTLTYLNSETETNVRIQFEVYSSNNLNVDSLQDLTNLLKPNNISSFIGFSLDESNQLYSIRYVSSIWEVAQIMPPPYDYKPVLSVEDIVTTI